MRLGGFVIGTLLLAGCAATLPSTQRAVGTLGSAPVPGPALRSSVTTPVFVGFWQSWSDTDSGAAFQRLGSVPASVTTVDVAFALTGSNAIGQLQNTYPFAAGARALRRQGTQVLLSFCGGGDPFDITDPALFVKNLRAYVRKHPYYSGFDFDDETIQNKGLAGERQLIAVILATRNAFPRATISFDAAGTGADPQVNFPNYNGIDRRVLFKTARAIDYVNIMDYDNEGYQPPGFPTCTFSPSAAHDCYKEIVQEFTKVPIAGGGTLPKSKVVMGLMTGADDYGAYLSPAQAAGYATWVKNNGYRGMMIWSLSNDNPRPYPNGSGPKGETGSPTGSYVNAIATALGT